MAENFDDRFAAAGKFEWDENKRLTNIAKHGVDFIDAAMIFSDLRHFTYRSAQPSSEPRFVTVGMVRSRLLAVVTTPRGDKLRIISVRAARQREKERYGK
ncbi:MAG: BrnT family toxin [Pseudorhodoplanes sp.]|nr:BrnT family toxin [Pseudorhodoplanes sp.]